MANNGKNNNIPKIFGSALVLGGMAFVVSRLSRDKNRPSGLPGAEISEEERHKAEEEYKHELELEHQAQPGDAQ